MKIIFSLFFSLSVALSSMLHAEDLDVILSFDSLPLPALIKAIYGDVLHENYILHQSVVKSTDVVSIKFRDKISQSKLRSIMSKFLYSYGFTVYNDGDFLYIRPSSLDANSFSSYVYQCKHRSSSYILSYMETLFSKNKLSGSGSGSSQFFGSEKKSSGSTKGLNKLVGKSDNLIVFTGSKSDLATFKRLAKQIDSELDGQFV
jgi:type II secretory pathway component GspD/PulD (secretin)